ncbi:MAG: tetratricopeptide repeat protein [Saprospiraceae bacterium]|jgi:hypothetical protein|nr:tetratricopeptide repeat protein [Saprospiraceae bacterium]
MSSSKEVFALRKAGSLDEAYSMALEVIEAEPNDEWNIKAFAWCLYDLTKRAVSQNNYPSAKIYVEQLETLKINELDEILIKSVEHAKVLASPERKIILQAKEKGKQGNHDEALTLYRQAIQQFPDDIDLNIQFAWELQKEGKQIFDTDKVDVQKARKLLADYIKLKNPRPSLLHSLFLRFADKIKDIEEFNLISFLKLWDLKNLTEEDFEPYSKDEKTYPSSAEKVIQHAAKLILDKKLTQEIDFFLPFLDIGIKRFQDNIWLPYYKAKLLHLVNRSEEAVGFLIPVVKEKISDYWTWSLLAELVIENDKEKAVSCYCKSLLCKGDDKLIANVRTRFAELLIQKGLWNEARFEIASAIVAKEKEGAKVSDRLRDYQQQDWYKNAVEKKSNNDFYNSHKQLAEEFIFHSLAWFDSCLGESFTIPAKPDKPRRKLFIKLSNEVIEVVVSDRKFNTSRNYSEGDSIRIKGEYDKEKSFQIYLLEKRNSQENWDLFDWRCGNVVQAIKNETGKITAWRISALVGEQMKEGIIDVQDFKAKFQLREGLPIFVKIYQKEKPRSTFLFSAEKESRVHILSIRERTNGKLWDSFPEQVGIVDYINYEKGIAHFIINKRIDSIIKLHQINEKIEIGAKLSVRLKKVAKERDSYYTVLSCSVTNNEPTEILLKPFSGMIQLSGSIGFADDIYIDSSLINEHKIEDGDVVNGTAIINFNKKKETWGWKAIKII